MLASERSIQRPRYGFSEVRVATLYFAYPYRALGIPFLRRRDCQVVRPNRHLAKVADGPCRYFDARLHFDTHPIWQATKSKLERSDAFGFVSHEGSPRFAEPKVALLSFNYLICADQYSGWHGKPERLRRLRIDNHQIFNWLLDGK